jgi:hypothetical protein
MHSPKTLNFKLLIWRQKSPQHKGKMTPYQATVGWVEQSETQHNHSGNNV